MQQPEQTVSEQSNGHVEVFYSDPVDEDDNVIGKVTMTNWCGPCGPIEPVKVPHGEIVLDPEDTIQVDLGEDGS